MWKKRGRERRKAISTSIPNKRAEGVQICCWQRPEDKVIRSGTDDCLAPEIFVTATLTEWSPAVNLCLQYCISLSFILSTTSQDINTSFTQASLQVYVGSTSDESMSNKLSRFSRHQIKHSRGFSICSHFPVMTSCTLDEKLIQNTCKRFQLRVLLLHPQGFYFLILLRQGCTCSSKTWTKLGVYYCG